MNMIFNFYALPHELYGLWNWIVDLPGASLIEADSRPDLPNRNFETFPLDEVGTGDFSVVTWLSDAGGKPRHRHMIFEPATRARLAAKGRTSLVSPSFIRLHSLAAPSGDLIGPCELIYWTEKAAAASKRFDEDQMEEVHWEKLAKQVAAIKKQIASRSVGRWRSTPVSEGVAQLISKGKTKLWLWGSTGTL